MEKDGLVVTALVRDALGADERARGVKIFRTKSAKVLSGKSLEKIITTLGSNFDYDEFMRAMWMLRELIPKLAFMGVAARFPGVGVLSPSVSGKIDPDDPDWKKKVKVGYRFRLEKELQRAVAEEITVNYEPIQEAHPTLHTLRFTNPKTPFSGEVPIGAMLVLEGDRLKFNSENPEEGLFFTPSRGLPLRVPEVLIRGKELVFKVPAELKPGIDYSIQVRAKLYRCRTIRRGDYDYLVRILPSVD